jgi:hypothetical protein
MVGPSAGGPAAATAVQPGGAGPAGEAPPGAADPPRGGVAPPRRGPTGPLPGPKRLRAPWSRRLVLGDAIRAVREALLLRLRPGPRESSAEAWRLPAHQAQGPATEGRAVEERLHDALAFLPRVRDRAGRVRPARVRVVGLEPVDVDRWAALEAAREGQRTRIRASDGSHAEGALPPWTGLADLGGVEWLPGPQQLVAHPERRVHPTRA